MIDDESYNDSFKDGARSMLRERIGRQTNKRYEEEKARIEAYKYKTTEVKMSPSEATRMKNVK